MNSLIALGASTSFAAGAASALLPGFSLDPSFLEEPVMLLAFVLLGRSLEARARAAASADLTALARLIPDSARLVLDPGAAPRAKAATDGGGSGAAAAAPAAEEVMVRTATVRAGDVVRVLPGERVPVDGVVIDGTAAGECTHRAGPGKVHQGARCSGVTVRGAGSESHSPTPAGPVHATAVRPEPGLHLTPDGPGHTHPKPLGLARMHPSLSPHLAAVDESMLTGESRLVPVSEGSAVTGGTLAYEAPLTLRATSTGSASTLAGIGR